MYITHIWGDAYYRIWTKKPVYDPVDCAYHQTEVDERGTLDASAMLLIHKHFVPPELIQTEPYTKHCIEVDLQFLVEEKYQHSEEIIDKLKKETNDD